jgi:hypothetical protein
VLTAQGGQPGIGKPKLALAMCVLVACGALQPSILHSRTTSRTAEDISRCLQALRHAYQFTHEEQILLDNNLCIYPKRPLIKQFIAKPLCSGNTTLGHD